MVMNIGAICSPFSFGYASTTSCPRLLQRRTASSTAFTQSGWIFTPDGAVVVNAIRSLPGSKPTSSINGRTGGGAQYGSPTSGPDVSSSKAALSRTDRVTACSATRPLNMSPKSGPSGLRARVGLSANTPQHEAGIRIERPPSLACANGTMPAATAAAEPPLEPPVARVGSHGFRVRPNNAGSVVGRIPYSGVLVLPTTIRPARL